MKRLFLLFAIVATTMFAGCKSDDDEENTPVEYTIVGFTDSELPEAWQGAEEAGLTVRTDMYITELKGKKEVGHKEEGFYGTNGDRLSLVAYNADNIRIEYTLTFSLEEVQHTTEVKTISVSLYNHRTIRLADF
mgnify:FL=1